LECLVPLSLTTGEVHIERPVEEPFIEADPGGLGVQALVHVRSRPVPRDDLAGGGQRLDQ
jgi:hypothetical protein